MCDRDHYDDDLRQYQARGGVTRREFGALSLGAGMSFLLPRAADAQTVTETDVKIKTPDGVADAYFVHPAKGAHAAVLVWPDILGLRPAFRQIVAMQREEALFDGVWLNHRLPWLWRFHNVHHVDPDLDLSTAFRFHFGEIALSAGSSTRRRHPKTAFATRRTAAAS